MIGTSLIEELVQTVVLSHRIKHGQHLSLLLMARPESGKTTIARAANAKHVCPVAVMSGRSIVKEIHDHPETEFLLFNDLTCIRAMSQSAVLLLINLLNQITQNEHGKIGFAGKETEEIDRQIGIIACLPFSTFRDQRTKWNELGFVSRMLPFCYAYDVELVAEIKTSMKAYDTAKTRTHKILKTPRRDCAIEMSKKFRDTVQAISDAKAIELKQIGLRLLQSYLCLVRAHALWDNRRAVNAADIAFLRAVDHHISITECKELSRA